MLICRSRSRGRGGGGRGGKDGEGLGPQNLNGLWFWGQAGSGNSGGGYVAGAMRYPQRVLVATKVVEADNAGGWFARLDNGEIIRWGSNQLGQGGIGVKGSFFGGGAGNASVPVPMPGGVRLYNKETLTDNKGGSFPQPDGPYGPLVTNATQIAGGGITRYALQDGKVLAWGSNKEGQCANGFKQKGEDPKGSWVSGLWRPQYAPWWVQIAGPKQGETGGAEGAAGLDTPGKGNGSGANILKGITKIAGARGCGVFLQGTTNRIYIACVGGAESMAAYEGTYYATPDPVWDAFLATLGGVKPIDVKTCSSSYTVLLSDGTLAVVGLCREGMFGNGTEGDGPPIVRRVGRPEVSPGVLLDGIVKIGMGQWHQKALNEDGELITWGSNGPTGVNGFNLEGQQGLGEDPDPVTRPTPITSLNAGGKTVIDFSAGGKQEIRGSGDFGGDTCCALLSDGTPRTWGQQFNSTQAAHDKGTGVCGDGTEDTKATPVNVKPALSDIVAVYAGAQSMIAVQEPGVPLAVPSIVCTSPASKVLRIQWFPILTNPPTIRTEESWRIRWRRAEANPLTGLQESWQSITISDAAAKAAGFIFDASIVSGWEGSSEVHEVEVKGNSAEVHPTITGGAVKTATFNAGTGLWELPIAWPLVSEPAGWHAEWQLQETYKSKPSKLHPEGQDVLEDYAISPLLADGTTFYLAIVPPFSQHELAGKNFKCIVEGAYSHSGEGSFGARTVEETPPVLPSRAVGS